jgi:cell wall-associated NlpC family hydrolase
LVQQIFKEAGFNIPPRISQAQAEWGTDGVHGVKTSVMNLQAGDIVAWYGGEERGQYIGHVAIYAGNGEIIENNGAPGGVRRRKIGSNENAFGVHLYLPGDPGH